MPSMFYKTISGVLGYWRQGPAKLTDPITVDWFGGQRSSTGKHVGVDNALQIVPVYACIRLIAQTFGTLPADVKVWNGEAMVPSRDHPLFALLHEAPNADMSAVEFWAALCVSYLAWGNAYAEIHRVMGRVVALTPLRPDMIAVRRDDRGALVYTVQEVDGPREVAEGDVLHVKNLSLDGLTGMSPLGQARNSLGVAMAAEETAGKLFANGMRTSGYLQAPNVLSAQQRKDAQAYVGNFQGSANAGRVPLLEGGWSFQSFALPPQDAELLATRSFEIESICRLYGVPPWLIGHTEKSTSWGTGLESQLLGFYTLTLRPIVKNFEGAIKRRLILPAERGRVEVDFNHEGLLRADSQGRAAFMKTMVEAGIMTRNEARKLEGLVSLPGGDSLTVQSNQLPLDKLGEATTRADLAPAAIGGTPA